MSQSNTGSPSKSHRPPGPKGRMLMGSLGGFVADPLTFMLKCALRYGDIVYYRLGWNPVFQLSDPEYIKEVLVSKASVFPKADLDFKILSKFLGRGLITNEGASHRRQRRLAQPAFHPRRVESYADVMVNYTLEMMERWGEDEERDMADEMTRLTMFIAARTLFGADVSETAETAGNAIHILQDIAQADYRRGFVPPVWVPTAGNRLMKKARAEFHAIVDSIIARRREKDAGEDHGDLLSMLLLARDEETGKGMSDEQVRDEVTTLFAAGHETTSNALVWTFHLLARNPEAREKLQEELDRVLGDRPPTLADLPHLPWTEMVIKESMRVYPPVWILNTRQAAEDVVVGDYTIRKGELVFIAPWVQHRLPRWFPEPEKFRPERFEPEQEKELPRYAYIPFGAGPRICIGNSFAMMEARLILAAVASRYTLESAGDGRVELLPRITLSPAGGLPMRVRRRATVHA